MILYPGLVIDFPWAVRNHDVRILINSERYSVLGDRGIIGNVSVKHAEMAFGTDSYRVIRNCTKAEARMLGMDLKRLPKVGDFIVIFEPTTPTPNIACSTGIFTVVKAYTSAVFEARLVKDTNNGVEVKYDHVIVLGESCMVINWKGL